MTTKSLQQRFIDPVDAPVKRQFVFDRVKEFFDEVNKKASDQGKWVAYEVRWNEKTEYKESLIIHSHIGFSSEYFIENKTTADQIVTNHLSFVEGL